MHRVLSQLATDLHWSSSGSRVVAPHMPWVGGTPSQRDWKFGVFRFNAPRIHDVREDGEL